jgi:glycosyltransferase involved in cell wall biosynthesis
MPKNKIRILLGITLSEMGGAQKVVFDIIESLPQEFYKITLVTYPGGELIQWVKDLNKQSKEKIQIIPLDSLRREISPWYDLKTLFLLYRVIKKGKYDITHFHSSKMGILGRWAAWMAKTPKILFTVHGWGINEYQPWFLQKILGFIERITGRVCNHIICVSKQHQDIGIQNKWINPQKTSVVYNGLSLPPDTKEKLRRELKIDKDITIIGTIMRLRDPKDPLFTIRVFYRLKKYDFKMKLVIIGEGPLRSNSEKLIEELDLRQDVYLMGTRMDARELLNDIDIFTLFTKWEGLPLVLMEAMFGGKPIVASNVGGISELIADGEIGYLLDDLDVNKAVKIINNLLENKETMKTLGEKGQKIAYRFFTKERMIKEYQRIYEGVYYEQL